MGLEIDVQNDLCSGRKEKVRGDVVMNIGVGGTIHSFIHSFEVVHQSIHPFIMQYLGTYLVGCNTPHATSLNEHEYMNA